MSLMVLSDSSTSMSLHEAESSSVSLPPRLLWEFLLPKLARSFTPVQGVLKTVGVALVGAQLIASGLSTEVVETILHSRAPSARNLSLKWIVQIVSCSQLTAQLVSFRVPAVTIFHRLDPLHL